MKSGLLNGVAMMVAVLMLAIGGPLLVREFRTLPRAKALVARADQRIVTLEVGGMTCAGCAASVQGNLATVPGVSAVDVRLGQDRAYVVCERDVADSALTRAIHRAGPGFIAAVVRK